MWQARRRCYSALRLTSERHGSRSGQQEERRVAGDDSFRSIGPVMANVNATGLRTALRRCALSAELPLVADSGYPGYEYVFTRLA